MNVVYILMKEGNKNAWDINVFICELKSMGNGVGYANLSCRRCGRDKYEEE